MLLGHKLMEIISLMKIIIFLKITVTKFALLSKIVYIRRIQVWVTTSPYLENLIALFPLNFLYERLLWKHRINISKYI